MRARVCVRACVYVCMYVCTYVCMYILIDMTRGQRRNANRTEKQEEIYVICDGSGNGSTPHNHTARAAPGASTTDQVSANPENTAGVVVTAPVGGSPVVLQGNKDTPQGEPSRSVEEVRHN